MSLIDDNEDTNTWLWRMGGITRRRTTWAPGRLVMEGPFSNPARMIEDLFMGNPDPYGDWDESRFYASVWAHAGWWDKEYAR